MTSVRELWQAHKAKRPDNKKAKKLAQHRKYAATEKGQRTRKVVRDRRYSRERSSITDFSQEDWQKALEYFGHRCAYCESDKSLHQDHFIPLVLGGTFTRDNVVPACHRCNASKRDLDPLEWFLRQEHGLVIYAKVASYLKDYTERMF